MDQQTQSKGSSRAKIIVPIVIVSILLFSALAGGFYLGSNLTSNKTSEQPTPSPSIPLDFDLNVSPSSVTVMQGNSVAVNVSVAYLQGSSENVTVNAVGVPDGATCAFSQSEGTPANGTDFNCTLTIQVSEAVPTSSYPIMVNATSDNGKIHTCNFTLSVLSAEVKLTGLISGGRAMPSEIIFEELSPTGATVQTFSASINYGTFGVPTYSITLPNQQFYAVSIKSYNFTYHYVLPYGISAGVGVTSLDCQFS
jgi:hypothetical protein